MGEHATEKAFTNTRTVTMPLEIDDVSDTERFLRQNTEGTRRNDQVNTPAPLASLSPFSLFQHSRILFMLVLVVLVICGTVVEVSRAWGVVIVVQHGTVPDHADAVYPLTGETGIPVASEEIAAGGPEDDDDDKSIAGDLVQLDTSRGDASLIDECQDGKYTKRTLKLAYELPFAALFSDNKGQKKYEASSVIIDSEGLFAYAIHDSSWAVSKFPLKLEPFGVNNSQIGDPDREEKDSDYEAIFQDDGNADKNVVYAVRESIKHDDKTYHAIIEKLSLNHEHNNYTLEEACSCEFEFEGDSKGFEGAISIRDLNNEMIVLGLCEGNHCSEKKSKQRDKGHGRVVLMRQSRLPNGACQWSTIRVTNLPKSANFDDYSDITMDTTGRVAITSQEDSSLWIGQLLGQDETTGLWDLEKLAFDEDVGDVYYFPKNANCQTVYCNVEGVHFLNAEMVLTVSDKMKSKGKQDFRCFSKDQSVHVFVLP